MLRRLMNSCKRVVRGIFLYWKSYNNYRHIRREQAVRAANMAVGLTLSGALRRQH